MKNQEKNYTQCVLAVQKILNKLKPSTSTSQRSAVVALYTTDDDNPLRFSGKIGMLQLDFDRKFKTRFFRFYDLENFDLLMQFQLFYGFSDNYRKHKKQTLYVFDFFHDGSIGFQFRNEQDAKNMLIKVEAAGPKMQEFRQLQKSKIKKQIEQKQQKSLFGKFKKKWHQFRGDQAQQKFQSTIIAVQKKRSISFNFETGEFDLENIPSEWQEIFDTIGLSKKHLQNKQIMECIFEEVIIHQAKKTAEQSPEKLNQRQMSMIKQDNQPERDSDISSLKSSIMTCDFQNSTLCLPPPPDPSLLPPPPSISQPPKLQQPPPSMNSKKQQTQYSRANLMDQIRNNKIKLKPVITKDKNVELDASNMNKQQRKDLAQQIRLKLKKRQIALSRRQASQSSSSDSD